MPHGHCFLWKPWLLWMHVISDVLICLSYYSIPLTLLYLVRSKKGVEFSGFFLIFSLFIFACGTTHALEIYTMWVPAYAVQGVVKILTAFVSLGAAIALVPAVRQVLQRPTRRDLENAYREIELANERLVEARNELHEANSLLESRVQQRTAELETQTKELERSNQELAQFAHVASHDLQEPLRAVGTYCDLLTRRCQQDLSEKGQGYLDRINQSVDRMRSMLEDLLKYSLVGARLNVSDIDLNQLVMEVVDNLGERRQDVASLDVKDLPRVRGDYSQLFRVFQNLLTNALKYKSERPLEVTISAEETGTEWHLKVKDNGLGFKQEFADKMFVIFQRLHTADKFAGSGIGLPICRRIVEAHGGSIWAEGALGQGATIHFTLKKELPDA